MRIVIQRVRSAHVEIEGQRIAEIAQGLLVLIGIGKTDTEDDATWLAEKLIVMRIFPDETGQMNRSIRDVAGEVLVVSQFTLFASTRKGTRPSFNDAARPDQAIPLYERFLEQLESALGHTIARGQFGANMQVSLVNDGPVTLMLERG